MVRPGLTDIPTEYAFWKLQQYADLNDKKDYEMAQGLGMSKQSYSYLKYRKGNLSEDILVRICKFLNIDVDTFDEDLISWQRERNLDRKKKVSVVIDDVPLRFEVVYQDEDVRKYVAKIAQEKYGFSKQQGERVLDAVIKGGVIPSTARDAFFLV